ncbi:hypothetical protein [Xanthomonas campestris]|uniref:hypothetical protein n=1 Tax=Xanthomonas campestris TaxID=339 RepID=UPI002B222B0D|nr:hypothetical protein [Xanthomonas campestris]
MTGPIFVMTGLLPDAAYISQIISGHPNNIFMIANSAASTSAQSLKKNFLKIRIVIHPNNNAKVVLVAPDTVWVSSSDFGKSEQIESAIGMHSEGLYKKTLDALFNKVWAESQEIK